MAIAVKNLQLGYGEHIIIPDLSIHIPKNSFSTIIGPNGCGKSTLLKALSRNLKIKKGSISINGRLIHEYKTRHLARILAFLAQTPPVLPQFLVRELVSYGRYPYTNWLGRLTREDQQVIDWAMQLTEIINFADRQINCLSGGEKQRVWLAMALAQQAEILLLDEPTTHLDIAHQFQTLELIKKLHQEMQCTILMVLHDLNQAARYSDQLFVLKDGQLYARGTPREIITEKLLFDAFAIETKVIRDETYGCPFFIPLRGVNQ